MFLKLSFFALVCVWCVNATIDLAPTNPGFDQSFYEDVLDEELCQQQLDYIENNVLLRLQFIDAGIRMPRGILDGNLVDMGNYYQCLGIREDISDSIIEGKYCSILVPFDQELQLPTLPGIPDIDWPNITWPNITLPETRQKMQRYRNVKNSLSQLMGQPRVGPDTSFSNSSLEVAVCLPKSCTTRQAVDSLYFNLLSALQFEDNFCRLPNDKPWVPADYVATVLFSILGLLTILSTGYDIIFTIIRKSDQRKVNGLYKSFSVYSNTKKLLTFSSNAKVIQCLDGIRVIAMMWIIVGHTYSTQTSGHLMNPVLVIDWLESLHSIWITAAPISVDTFFMLSGLLLVYTTTGKLKSMTFLTRVPMFYMNRLLRMFPLLAVAVLLQCSWFHRVADGPNWNVMLENTHHCRAYWWATVLHVQNYVVPHFDRLCLTHTWYLSVDTQLYILSPVVLFWVFYNKRAAWCALTLALCAMIVASTAFNVIHGFRSALLSVGIIQSPFDDNYMTIYYMNTLTRGSPFLVGMLFGYILYETRSSKLRIGKKLAASFWLLSIVVSACVIYITFPIQQANWDQPILDVIINSFMRPAWAACIGWMIFACEHGYGGFINFLLSHRVWKVPSKISYAMYIFHYPLIFIVNGMGLTPVYFRDEILLFRFFGDLMLAFLVAFLATVLIDAPFGILINLATGKGPRKPSPKSWKEDEVGGVVNPVFSDVIKTKL